MLDLLDSKPILEVEQPSLKNEEDAHFFCFDIQPYLPHSTKSRALVEHLLQMKKILAKMLCKEFLLKEKSEMQEWLNRSLPLIQWNEIDATPDTLSIYLFCKPSKDVKTENILLDVIKKWLIPEREIQILSFQNMYCHLREIGCELFFISELKILIEDGRDLGAIQNNLPILSKELALAITSSKYAEYLLDTKALSYDQKGTCIHQELIRLINKRPNDFSKEIFTEMGRFLALSNKDFRDFRPHRHVTRLVASHHLMHKKLSREISLFPEKRYLEVRLIRTQLRFPFGSKPVLGLAIGLTLFDKYESFEETHILSAMLKFIDSVHIVKDSFFAYQGYKDPVRLLYVELEKKDGMGFSQSEIRTLKLELEDELKKRIEKLIPSVFMIRNEEEIMKNILLLNQELKYLSDFPQVMISLEKQTPTDMYFTLVLVRLLKRTDQPLEKCFQRSSTPVKYIPERVQTVGYLRKRTPKEANVFHLVIPKDRGILRADSSVNFYLARQKVVQILHEVLGDIRDFNGGMILKQGELFSQFKDIFKEVAERNHELLENFFFSLNPIEMQATLPLSSIQKLFYLYLEAIEVEMPKKESCFWKIEKDKNITYVVVRAREPSIKEALADGVYRFDNFSKSLIKTQVNFQGSLILGYIYETSEEAKQELFAEAILRQLKEWTKKVKNQQVLKLSFLDLPRILDPRFSGDMLSGPILKMLFDGLTRIGHGSKPMLSIAKSVEISKDFKQYIFKLRECYWSNETRVIAYDFEYAWKKVLSPKFSTPFAYFFYPIKNAKAAKEGNLPIDDVGVRAIDDTTLVIQLEHPTPEFLELTAYPLYAPVNHLIDKIHPNWSQGQEDVYVCNGPFKLKSFNPNTGMEFVKNHCYWDKQAVSLERILISKSNAIIANEMFKKDEIDWIGRPMRPWEPFFEEGSKETVLASPLGIYWCIFNTEKFPFQHPKIRQAFAYAINREELVKHLSYECLPAASPLPLDHTQNYDASMIRGDQKLAVKLFEEALAELGITRDDFPVISFIYTADKMREKIIRLLKSQLEKVLGIFCQQENYEFHTLFNKMVQGDYHVGGIAWKSWVNDAIYTLNAFKYRTNKVNFAKWENQEFQKLLDEAQQEIDSIKRLELLKMAEKILVTEMPVVPIFYEVFHYMQKKHLHQALHFDTGGVDFKWAYIDHDI
ncbi:MAG TPA: peptide ABC transporter substrate-binding protein [Rhabdochlamydiaceae bacterium]|nr:peptide ABC transporter substrate-binding protein [Rhabdochlamydiaceae bacterium]